MKKNRIGIMAVVILCFTATVAFSQTSRYWDHGGTDDRWSNATNWTSNIGPTNGEIAIFGDNAPNTPQTVLLDTNITLNRLSCPATGNRDYTINSTNGAFITLTGGHDIYCVGRTAALTINCNIVNAGADLQIDRIGGVTTINGDCSGGYMYAQDPGELVLAGSNSWSFVYMYGGEIFAKHPNALGSGYFTSKAPVTGYPEGTLSLATNVTIPTLLYAESNMYLRLRDSGTNDITLTIGERCLLNRITVVTNAGNSTGRLFIRLLVASAHEAEWTLASNSAIVVANATGTAQLGTNNNSAVGTISGDGSVLIESGNLVVVNCTNNYTGGTTIRTGRLRIGANDRLPVEGDLIVEPGAYFDLLARTQTVRNLSGGGTVELGAGTTPGRLTVNGTLAPGMSAGTMTFSDPGMLVLGTGSISRFELNATNGVNDQVVFTYNTAGVTFGGTLQVVNLGGMQDGNYKLFDLAGGPISNSYTEVALPSGWQGTLATTGGDLVLTVRKLYPGTLITIK